MDSLSDFQERVYIRLLVNSDDYGVIPSDLGKLFKMSGFKEMRQTEFNEAVNLLLDRKLIFQLTYNEVIFYIYPPATFDKIQTNLTNRRQSEYTGIKAKTRAEFDQCVSYITLYNKSANPSKEAVFDDSITLYKKSTDKDKDIAKDNSKAGGTGGDSGTQVDAPVEVNQQQYFELKTLFREQFYSDSRELNGIQTGHFTQQLMAYGEERLKTDIQICHLEGWKSVGSLVDFRAGKLKRKAERYGQNNSPTVTATAPRTPYKQQNRIPATREERESSMQQIKKLRSAIDIAAEVIPDDIHS